MNYIERRKMAICITCNKYPVAPKLTNYCQQCMDSYLINAANRGLKIPEEASGTKYDQDKPRTDLLSSIALIEVAKVMGHGAKKYQEHNWRQGIKWSRLLGAAMRHLLAYMRGEDKDPETGLSHMAHLACCAMFLIEYSVTHKDLDDRYKTDIN